MSATKTTHPVEESPEADPVSRLVSVLVSEGFQPLHEESDWKAFGEQIYHRPEHILFTSGETAFVFIDFPDLNDQVLQQAVEKITEMFRARSRTQKAVSVLQATTVYVCIIARNDTPHTAQLSRYITSTGGAVIIPVIIVPEINHVVYPAIEEKVGSVRPRIEYLQYLLGERRDKVDVHRQTIRAFYISVGVLAVILVAIIFSMFA